MLPRENRIHGTMLMIEEQAGGQVRLSEDDYIEGSEGLAAQEHTGFMEQLSPSKL